MFKENKYTKWYYNIINARLSTPHEGYVERHHIVPKSMGGSNRKDNIVALTAREHFICHWLLTKMTDAKGMRLALLSMTRTSSNQERYKVNGRTFQHIREAAGNAQRGELNPNYGKKHSPETRAKMSAKRIANRGQHQHTEESKEKISSANKGNRHSAETKAQWSSIRKGRPGLDNNSGKRWWNNGTQSVLKKDCPDGYVLGRLT